MNIVIVSAMFPPVRTGTSFYTRNLAHALQQRGHEVTVVTLENKTDAPDKHPYPVHRLRAIHFSTLSFFKHFRIACFFPGNYLELRRIASEKQADVIFVVNHYLDIVFPAIFAARSLELPLVCSVGTQLQSGIAWRNRVLNVLDRIICGGLVFPFCSRIVAWDNEILRYLSDVQGSRLLRKCSIVNYGVNGVPAELLAHEHDYVRHNQVLCVGSVIRQRNYIPLIRAFAQIAEEFPALQLKIIGHIYFDEPLRVVREMGLDGRVIFSGELPHAKVLEEFKRSDLYYVSLTGRYFGLGTATIESMLMGIPVVANVPLDILGKAALENYRHIVAEDSSSAEGLADQLRRLLQERDLRAQVGRGGRDFIVRNMTWERVAEDMEQLLAAEITKA